MSATTPTNDGNAWRVSLEIHAVDGAMRPLTAVAHQRLLDHLQEVLPGWMQQNAEVRKAHVAADERTPPELTPVYAWARRRKVLDSHYRLNLTPQELDRSWEVWSSQERDWFELLATDFGRPDWVMHLRNGELLHHYPYYLM